MSYTTDNSHLLELSYEELAVLARGGKLRKRHPTKVPEPKLAERVFNTKPLERNLVRRVQEVMDQFRQETSHPSTSGRSSPTATRRMNGSRSQVIATRPKPSSGRRSLSSSGSGTLEVRSRTGISRSTTLSDSEWLRFEALWRTYSKP